MYGSVITMWPITTVGTPFGTPSVWKRSSSEIPNTTYGMTSGLRSSAETSALPRNRRRASAIDASDAEQHGADARQCRDDRTRTERSPEVAVDEELVVPVEREPARAETSARRSC